MKQRKLIIGLAMLLSGISLKAQDLFMDMGSSTNYMAHGRTVSNNLACMHPSMGLSFDFGTTISTWFSLTYDRSVSFLDEYDLIVSHSQDILEDSYIGAINVHAYGIYWLNPKVSNPEVEPDLYHGSKFNAGISKNLALSVPYRVHLGTGYDYYNYQIFGEARDMLTSAGIHEFHVLINKGIKNTNIEGKVLISNNRGAINPNIVPGWSYLSQHLSLSTKLRSVSVKATANYQWTLEETLHPENLLWFGFNVSRSFKI